MVIKVGESRSKIWMVLMQFELNTIPFTLYFHDFMVKPNMFVISFVLYIYHHVYLFTLIM